MNEPIPPQIKTADSVYKYIDEIYEYINYLATYELEWWNKLQLAKSEYQQLRWYPKERSAQP